MSSFITVEPTVIVLCNTVARVSVSIQDSAGVAVDPYELILDVMDVGGNILITDTYPTPALRLVRVATGKYYIDFGNQPTNNETATPTEWLFNWRVTLTLGGQQQNSLQKIKVISALEASYLPELKLLIDKSRKLVSSANQCYLGYENQDLIMYLEGGLQNINAYQPSLTFTFETFPLIYKQLLLDAALITGVMSQELYAIDTDIPNYSDQGTSFVITHQAQLASFLNSLVGRLDKLIPQMKLQLIQSGAMHIQAGPNYRFNTLVQSGPSGATFRGVNFRW